MPITENVGGVLRKHTAEFVNVDGVIKEQNTVTVNDGGVLREVYSANKVKLEGITPLVVADDHIVITQSGSGTISLPAGARIILGSGGWNTRSGYVAEYTLTGTIKNASFTATICRAYTGPHDSGRRNSTTLVVAGKTYNCGAKEQIIQSKWGPIGGYGGCGEATGDSEYEAEDGTGAGGAGGLYHKGTARRGGNNEGYGNFGGNGSDGKSSSEDGSSGNGSTKAGSGGGGGYAAGGGESAYDSVNDDETGTSASCYYRGEHGEPGAGIIVIEW